MAIPPQKLYQRYASAVAYIVVEKPNGDQNIGSAFHVGENVFVTARHVIEGHKIIAIGTTVSQDGRLRNDAIIGSIKSGPYFHPDNSIDVAALVVDGLDAAVIPLGSNLDDMLDDHNFILRSVLALGYPPIPFSKYPLLVAAKAEINAVVDQYIGGHPHLVISAMARGGFSGGPCLIEWDFAIGLITQVLISDHKPTELGYMAVLTVEPIFVCLQHHKLIPKEQKEGWDGLWD